MPDIDFALAFKFIEHGSGRIMQLRFRQNYAPPGDERVFDGTGQLYAIVVDPRRSDNGDEVPISRPDVRFDDVEQILTGWQQWATLHVDEHGHNRWINLGDIQRRIDGAGLGLT